jgi:hypothetical protein
MPEIVRFYGIIIKMFFIQKKHNPPHIHAIYGEYVSAIDINSFEVIEGDLPNKALLLVREWMKINQKDLLEIWNTQQFRELPPLV